MKKLRNNKIIYIIFISIILPISMVYIFYKPNNTNKIIKNNIYKESVNSYFDDSKLYNCVISAYNKENNTSKEYSYNLSESELSTIKTLNCSVKGITSTKGVEKLVNLTSLNLSKNSITEIDLSKNTELSELRLNSNKLTSIDLSKNTKLIYLSLFSNKLTSIDLSKNTSLLDLYLYYNNLTSINLSNNKSLLKLDLGYNKLSSIDLTNNIVLSELLINSNKLTSIDLTKNINLKILDLYSNELTTINLNNNPNLTELYLYENNITNIDLSSNTKLTNIDLSSNKLNELDLIKNINLTDLELRCNSITNIDLTNNTKLINLFLSNNQLTYLDLNKNTNLKYLYLSSNNYQRSIVTYKNLYTEIPDPIILPSSKTLTLNAIYNSYAVKSSDDKLMFDKSGKYSVTSTYQTSGYENIESISSITTISVIELVSDYYIIDDDNSLIYYDDKVFNKDKLSFNVGTESFIDDKLTIEYSDNNLIIKYDNNILKAYSIYGINFGNLKLNNNSIILDNELSYEDFTKEITTNNVTYKIINNTLEVISGNITNGMLLYVYKDNNLLKTYNIIIKDYNINLNIDSDNNYILDIKDGTSVSNILSDVNTSNTVNIYNNDNEIKSNNDTVATGDILKINEGENNITYTLIVRGDADGDGQVTARDALTIIRHSISIESLEDAYSKAGNVDGDEEITARDALNIIRYSIGVTSTLWEE